MVIIGIPADPDMVGRCHDQRVAFEELDQLVNSGWCDRGLELRAVEDAAQIGEEPR